MLRNQQGSISIIFALLILILASLFLITFQNMGKDIKTIQVRSKTYLCFKYQLVRLQKYVTKMDKLNQSLAILYPMQWIPKVGAGFKAMHRFTMLTQNYLHLKYLKETIKNRYCAFDQTLYFTLKLPYSHIAYVILKRKPNGTAILKKYKWQVSMFPPLKHPFPFFQLKAKIEHPRSSSQLKIHTEEQSWNIEQAKTLLTQLKYRWRQFKHILKNFTASSKQLEKGQWNWRPFYGFPLSASFA